MTNKQYKKYLAACDTCAAVTMLYWNLINANDFSPTACPVCHAPFEPLRDILSVPDGGFYSKGPMVVRHGQD